MSLFYFGENTAPVNSIRGISFSTLHSQQCAVCPLNKQTGFKPKHPQMPAYGNENPLIYMLGEAPGQREDEEGIPFVGNAGKFLHRHIPNDWESELRWNNCVRTRPKGNETPNVVSIECCRPSVIADIERCKPVAIFGFGNIPLQWATGRSGIRDWTGKRIPVKVGSHTCWFFPMLHPSYILHLDHEETKALHEQMEFVFQLNMEKAFQAVEDGLPEPIIHTREVAEQGIECLYNVEAIKQALEELWSEKFVGIDLETNCIRPYQADACILSIAISGKERTISFPLYHSEARWDENELTEVEDLLIRFIREAPCRKVSFALGFEMEWLGYFYGRELLLDAKWGDAQAQAFILDGRRWSNNSLDNLCLEHFGISIKAINNTDRVNLDKTPLDIVLQYNAIDAKYHLLTFLEQRLELVDRGLIKVYGHHVRRQRAAVLCQLQGVPIDQKVAGALAKKYESKLDDIEKEIEQTPLAKKFKNKLGRSYRPSAPKDAVAAFAMIGAYLDDTTEESIEKIDDPLAKLHTDWKGAAKVLSTYINPIRADIEDSCLYPDSLLHPLLSLHKTRTWRSSSEGPNIQNFPKHFGDSHEVRDALRAPSGYQIVSFDWGQIQARNVAMESKDRKLVKSFWNRHDIHADWRDRIFELYPQWAKQGLKTVRHDPKLLKWYRNRAKNEFVFASFFGAGGKKVATTLGVPVNIGYQLAEEFDNAFPELADWQTGLHEFYDKHGYATGLSGFRRYAPVAHTEIINTPIQSDEAIMVFDGMIRLCETGDERLVPMMMIHDDLNFLWQKREVEKLAEQVIDMMLACPFEWAHVVPLSVEMSVGESWDAMKEIDEKFESDRWKK